MNRDTIDSVVKIERGSDMKQGKGEWRDDMTDMLNGLQIRVSDPESLMRIIYIDPDKSGEIHFMADRKYDSDDTLVTSIGNLMIEGRQIGIYKMGELSPRLLQTEKAVNTLTRKEYNSPALSDATARDMADAWKRPPQKPNLWHRLMNSMTLGSRYQEKFDAYAVYEKQKRFIDSAAENEPKRRAAAELENRELAEAKALQTHRTVNAEAAGIQALNDCRIRAEKSLEQLVTNPPPQNSPERSRLLKSFIADACVLRSIDGSKTDASARRLSENPAAALAAVGNSVGKMDIYQKMMQMDVHALQHMMQTENGSYSPNRVAGEALHENAQLFLTAGGQPSVQKAPEPKHEAVSSPLGLK